MSTMNQEWIPMPKTGERCSISGLSRSAMRILVVPCSENEGNPPVESKRFQIPKWGSARKRFVRVASLREWIEKQPSAGGAEDEGDE